MEILKMQRSGCRDLINFAVKDILGGGKTNELSNETSWWNKSVNVRTIKTKLILDETLANEKQLAIKGLYTNDEADICYYE